MYDGFKKYGHTEASNYEDDRIKEPLWWQEQEFVNRYFSGRKMDMVLDAPVGTGRFFECYNNANMVIGIDISEEMLKQAMLKLSDPRYANIQVMQGDIFHTKFPAKHFDYTVCWRFAHLVPCSLLTNALLELGRVTKGEILLQTYIGPPYWKRVITALLRLPGKLYRKLSGNTIPPAPWGHIKAYFHTQKTISSSIAQAGLHIIQKFDIAPYKDSKVCVYRLSSVESYKPDNDS